MNPLSVDPKESLAHVSAAAAQRNAKGEAARHMEVHWQCGRRGGGGGGYVAEEAVEGRRVTGATPGLVRGTGRKTEAAAEEDDGEEEEVFGGWCAVGEGAKRA